MRRLSPVKALCMNTVILSEAMQMTYLILFYFLIVWGDWFMAIFLSIRLDEFNIALLSTILSNRTYCLVEYKDTLSWIQVHPGRWKFDIKYYKACYLETLELQENSMLLNLKSSFRWQYKMEFPSKKSLAL